MKLTVVLVVLIGILLLACSTAAPAPADPTPNIAPADTTLPVEPQPTPYPTATPSSVEVVTPQAEQAVEVAGLRLLEWEVKSHNNITLTIVGVVENPSDEPKEYLLISFDVYDKDGYALGQAKTRLQRLEAGKKWKFEANGHIKGEFGEIKLSKLSGS